MYTVIYMSDRLLTQANPNSRLTPPADLRSTLDIGSANAFSAGLRVVLKPG